MNKLDVVLEEALKGRRERGLLRSLEFDNQHDGVAENELIDFSSNDYLGFARDAELEHRVSNMYDQVKKAQAVVLGASGSRLLSGDSTFAQELERWLAEFHGTDTALLFNSGFDANMGLMASLPPPNSVVLFDELVHNSCREGIRLCRAQSTEQFNHNDVADLEIQLRKHRTGPSKDSLIIVVIETVYSMDGHIAPLKEMLDLTDKYGAFLVVDEAHGGGIYGNEGRGLTQHLGEEKRVYARVHTFGKALGCHGAVIVGSQTLRTYLVNYARPLIYSTSLPLHSLVTIRCAYEYMAEVANSKQLVLAKVIDKFRSGAKHRNIEIADSPSPIQAVIIPGNDRVIQCAKLVRKAGFRVFPIRAPTVPAGEERIRVVLHDFNTLEEVEALVEAMAKAIALTKSSTGGDDSKRVRLG
jgi:8-amino-7-oxononanoate synthase